MSGIRCVEVALVSGSGHLRVRQMVEADPPGRRLSDMNPAKNDKEHQQ